MSFSLASASLFPGHFDDQDHGNARCSQEHVALGHFAPSHRRASLTRHVRFADDGGNHLFSGDDYQHDHRQLGAKGGGNDRYRAI